MLFRSTFLIKSAKINLNVLYVEFNMQQYCLFIIVKEKLTPNVRHQVPNLVFFSTDKIRSRLGLQFAMSKGKAKTVLIDSHVSLRQCKLAVDALHAHLLKKEQTAAETELLPGKEQHIWLQVAVKKMQPEKKLKPSKMWVSIVCYIVLHALITFLGRKVQSFIRL